jgi:hypothetical protein
MATSLPNPLQHVRLRTDQGEVKGHVNSVQGRAVRVTPQAQLDSAVKITSVVTIGKEELNDAETSRASLVLDAFKGGDSLLSSPFVRKTFFPGYPLDTLNWPPLPTTQPKVNFSYKALNLSQRMAVVKALSNEEVDRQVVIVVGLNRFLPLALSHEGHQGPPGTGKTTVIAATVQSKIAENESNTIWVIAHSNVAVKNVAEKLAESGFLDFKLLVSKDFHYDW